MQWDGMVTIREKRFYGDIATEATAGKRSAAGDNRNKP